MEVLNSLSITLCASCCAAMSSYFFRKNEDSKTEIKNATGYLLFFYFTCLVLSLACFPEIWKAQLSLTMIVMGGSVGVLCVLLMELTSRALQKGPSGLTFAFQSASAVFPGFLLFLCFGPSYGFACSIGQIIGIILVLLGMFYGVRQREDKDEVAVSGWLTYALAGFLVQILILTLIQGRCLFFDCSEGIFASVSRKDEVWFMPGQFGAAFLLQLYVFFRNRRKIMFTEMSYGCKGGVVNFASTSLLLLATNYATPIEKTLLFPCFAVATIFLSNAWACWIYKENFNLSANSLCALGICVAVMV